MEKFLALILFFSATAHAITSDYFSDRKKPVIVEMGFQFLHPSFGDINNVVIRNPQTSTVAAAETGNANEHYPDVFAQTLRALLVVNEEKQATIDIKTFLPLNGLMQIDSGNTYAPEFVLYRIENQRPRVSVMGEMNLKSSWRVGLGVDLGFGVSSEANVLLKSGAGNYSSQRVSAKVKPRLVPIISLEHEGYRLFVQSENKVDFELNATAGATAFPPLNAVFDMNYTSLGAMFFEPWKFDLSKKFKIESWALGFGLSYELWSGYKPRALVIQNVTSTFSNGQSPAYTLNNLLVPRMTIEKNIAGKRWELGYEFKDSIFKHLPTGVGNYLDPPRHTFLLGVILPNSLGWEFGVNAQVSRLVPQTVVKTDLTEIGAGGYTASGWIYGGMFNVAIPFDSKKGHEKL